MVANVVVFAVVLVAVFPVVPAVVLVVVLAVISAAAPIALAAVSPIVFAVACAVVFAVVVALVFAKVFADRAQERHVQHAAISAVEPEHGAEDQSARATEAKQGLVRHNIATHYSSRATVSGGTASSTVRKNNLSQPSKTSCPPPTLHPTSALGV